jgi:lysylphosphatidylglycerol synthetase-like protein (DUF2156 family)
MKEKTKLYLAYFAKSLLLVMAVGLAVFALLSGAESAGTFKNIPNALPWIVLTVFVCIAFRWQILGGILIILFGVFTVLFFSAFQVLWILFLISLPLIILGFFLTLITH